MQSESNDLSKDISLNHHTQDKQPITQHGRHLPDYHARPRLQAGGESGNPRRSPSIASSSTSSSRGSEDSLGSSSLGLRRGSPVDRISEHERAWKRLSKRKVKGPGFTVVQGASPSTLGHIVITNFPNGMCINPLLVQLTHI